jgi:hypothetical protein
MREHLTFRTVTQTPGQWFGFMPLGEDTTGPVDLYGCLKGFRNDTRKCLSCVIEFSQLFFSKLFNFQSWKGHRPKSRARSQKSTYKKKNLPNLFLTIDFLETLHKHSLLRWSHFFLDFFCKFFTSPHKFIFDSRSMKIGEVIALALCFIYTIDRTCFTLPAHGIRFSKLFNFQPWKGHRPKSRARSQKSTYKKKILPNLLRGLEMTHENVFHVWSSSHNFSVKKCDRDI